MSAGDNTEGRGPSIHLKVAEQVTFATHQCDVPVVVELDVVNGTSEELNDLELRLTADPPVLAPRTWRIDRIGAGSSSRPRDRSVSLSGGLLDKLTERMRAEIRLELRSGDVLLAEDRRPMVALARNEWGGANTMPELLAAFVMPNDPAVQHILKDASRVLEAAGKMSSLEGYQSRSRTRTWEIISAIWSAVSRLQLTYAEPPASFERQGQKIRFPSTIEEHRLATCLDTALLFAAAIESAGLHPVIVFVEGHALAGAWLQPLSLPSLTIDEAMELRKAIDQDDLVLFETTFVTGGRTLPFRSGVEAGRRHVAGEREERFVYALDVRQARTRGILPLPAAVAGADVPAEGTGGAAADPGPVLDEAPDLPPFDHDDVTAEPPKTPAERLDRWQRSLLDLSKRNRLLNVPDVRATTRATSAVPIFCPDPALLEDKLAQGQRLAIITPPQRTSSTEEPDPELHLLRTGEDASVRFARDALEQNQIVANIANDRLEKSVIQLYRKAKADFEEGGSNTLFLALGMLRWSPPGDPRGRRYRAPLILQPVQLVRSSAAARPYLRSHEDDPVFNQTLAEMLRQDFQLDLGEFTEPLPTDQHGVDVRGVWDRVRTRIRETPGLEIVEDVVLSTFSFAKYLMWKDLRERTDALRESPFVRHMIDTPREPYTTGATFLEPHEVDRSIRPSDVLAPLNADSSQIVAIHASGKGGDFVLEGPPGTGKSETIGNIIVHNLGLGNRVLFVSEKMAALDVVYRRLEAAGLGDFCLELHSARANKREVLSQLERAWQQRQIHSSTEWDRKANRLAEVRSDLNRLVEALHAPGPAGVSARSAIGRLARYDDLHPVQLDWPQDATGAGLAPDASALERLEDVANRLGIMFSEIEPRDVSEFATITRGEWSHAWSAEMTSAARALANAGSQLRAAASSFGSVSGLEGPADDLDRVGTLADLARLVPACMATDLGFSLHRDGQEIMQALEQQLERLGRYRDERARLSEAYPDGRLRRVPLREWHGRFLANVSRIWPLNVLARRSLRSEMWAGMHLDRRSVRQPERDLEALIELAQLQTQMETSASELPAGTLWRGLETDADRLRRALDDGRRMRAIANRLATPDREFHDVCRLLERFACEGRERLDDGMPSARAANALVSAYEDFLARQSRFEELAHGEEEASAMPGDLTSIERIATTILDRAPRLNAWSMWVQVRREARAAGIGALIDALETRLIAPSQTREVFRTAYCRWLAPILVDARPELRAFTRVGHEELIQTFRTLDAELARLASAYVRATLSGKVPPRDGPQGRATAYGILARELQKQRRHKPVRQLIGEMGSALTALTPCLMMSPLSVAQFLPPDADAFDLVVFDEASQITVPDAIGAIARGKACIIVGDPKQMPPTRFFERAADDDDDADAGDLESILDEALAARVPHHRLTGHYRSRHESLITFSNHAYYGGGLVTYPSADTNETAVTLRRVEGTYAKGGARTNQAEAKAVVAEVVRRLRDPDLSRLSIGVVTFNSEQQRLVEDLLDRERRTDRDLERFFSNGELGASDPDIEPVFVKNLETVQGDQRDVILLSIGYGPTEPGSRTMSMNFGPLNRQGGERRLNVAITRATTEVVVFASFDSSMIDLSRTSAQAVTDLKAYLEYALRGPAALADVVDVSGADTYDSDFEFAVAEQLRQRGWTVRTQVGVSRFRIDLGVVHPDERGRFLAGIECDGASYHSSPTARDRDRVRQIVLENLGWQLIRIWSTDYFVDRASTIDKVHGWLEGLLAEDRASRERGNDERAADEGAAGMGTPSNGPVVDGSGGAAVTLGSADASAEHEDDAHPAARSTRQPMRSADRGSETDGDGTFRSAPLDLVLEPHRFHDAAYRPTLTRFAASIIDEEGPIKFKSLKDRIARDHGFQRTGRQIASQIWKACQGARRHKRTPDDHTVFWPEHREFSAIVDYRGLTINGRTRTWNDVPHPEKAGLVRQLMSDANVDIIRAVADEIGVSRVSEQFRNEIQQLVEFVHRTR
jgi:very-short-patch-repair endonuclease